MNELVLDKTLIIARDMIVGCIARRPAGRALEMRGKIYPYALFSCPTLRMAALVSDGDGTEFGPLLPVPEPFLEFTAAASCEGWEREKANCWPIVVDRSFEPVEAIVHP